MERLKHYLFLSLILAIGTAIPLLAFARKQEGGKSNLLRVYQVDRNVIDFPEKEDSQ